jgi:hypothetical protein
MIDVLDEAYSREQRTQERIGETMPEPRYDRYKINSLGASAETLRDTSLLREVYSGRRMWAGTILRSLGKA